MKLILDLKIYKILLPVHTLFIQMFLFIFLKKKPPKRLIEDPLRASTPLAIVLQQTIEVLNFI